MSVRIIAGAIIAALVTSTLLVTDDRSSQAEATVEVSMESPVVYLGEYPRIRVRIKAPSDKPVHAVDYAMPSVMYRGLSTLDASGQWRSVMGNYCGVKSNESDFVELAAGQSRDRTITVLQPFVVAGPHKIRVELMPFQDQGFVIDRALDLIAREIPPGDIVAKVRVPITLSPTYDAPGDEQKHVEFLNVSTEKGHELIMCRLGGNGICNRLVRICELDRDSRLDVHSEMEAWEMEPRFWVTYNRGGWLHRIRVVILHGEVVDRKTIGPAPVKRAGG